MQYEFHGLRNSHEYPIWAQMKNRCYNPRVKNYHRYGGRGITVCDRWLHSFANFYADMGPRPSPKHSLDREDANGPYCKDNCRWTTMVTQQNNRRDNRLILHDGLYLSHAAWERHLGFPSRLVSQRITKLGWDAVKALTTPPQLQAKKN